MNWDLFMKITLMVLLGAVIVLLILVMIKIGHAKGEIKKIKNTVNNQLTETIAMKNKVCSDTDIMLDALLIAQTKDKLSLLKLFKERKHLNAETVKELEIEIKEKKAEKDDKLEPIKKEYTPVD